MQMCVCPSLMQVCGSNKSHWVGYRLLKHGRFSSVSRAKQISPKAIQTSKGNHGLSLEPHLKTHASFIHTDMMLVEQGYPL